QGPVYLTLPREILSERLESLEYFDPARLGPPAATVADAAALERAAEMLATGRSPIAIVKSSGRDPGAVAPLVVLAEALGMPVFPVGLGLGGAPRLTLAALAAAVQRRGVAATTLEARRRRWEAEHRKLADASAARAAAVKSDSPIDMAWLSRCVGDAIDDETIVINEYDL